MPHRASSRLPTRLAGCLAVGVLALAGCTDDPAAEEQPASSSAAATASASGAASPSGSPTPSDTAGPSDSPTGQQESPSPTDTGEPPSGPGGTLRSRLLTAAELPGFNPQFRWAQGRTAPEDPSASFGTCQRFALTSVGAERAVVRRFRPGGAAAGSSGGQVRAGELVATFPDAPTARRAFAVLEAWRATCAERLQRYARSDVGGLQDVSVPGGRARWYLLTYGPVDGDPDARFFDAQGMALVGSRIAMLSMVSVGQDYSYEAGREPMAVAVREAARKLA